MANDNVIYFLFYDVHMPIILDIVSLVLGFVLVFFTYKINMKIRSVIIGTYFGMLIGGMIGCIVRDNLSCIIIGAVLGMTIFYFIQRYWRQGSKFIIGYIFFMKIIYVIVTILVNLYIEYIEEIFPESEKIHYSIHSLNECGESVDVAIYSALTLAIIIAFIYIKRFGSEKMIVFQCTFIGASQLLCFITSHPYNSLFYSGMDWRGFFVPYMGMDYHEDVIPFIIMILMVTAIFYCIQILFKKENT